MIDFSKIDLPTYVAALKLQIEIARIVQSDVDLYAIRVKIDAVVDYMEQYL